MQRPWTLSVLLAMASAGCFKDEGVTTGGADDASASASTTSTSLAPTTSGTSGPSTDTTGSGETSSMTEPASTSTSTESASSEVTSTSEDSTTTGTSRSECGDGIIEGDEGCDDGPMNADDALCTSTCELAKCFDGLLQPILGEECDFGMLNNNNGACLEDCTKAKCGDGFVFLGVEECDHGEDNQAGLYDGCTPMTCTLGPHCGDDVVQKPFEECDHGDMNGADGDMCGMTCKLEGNVVFVTSQTYTGNIGGISGADYECNKVAMEGGLPNAGAFRAWISDGTGSPSGWVTKPKGPFLLLDATMVAYSWGDLTDGALMTAINIKEDGQPIADYKFAWTGTSYDGKPLVGHHCEKWTNGTKMGFGAWGNLSQVDDRWTHDKLSECQPLARLICIEQ